MTANSSLKIDYRPTNSLIEYGKNPRKNDDVVDKMVGAMKEFGFRIPIVAKSDGSVIDGHLRLKAARKLGLETVPVVCADDLSDAQVKAFRLLANKSANWAEWDADLLAQEFEDLKNMNFDLELTGFDLDEINSQYLKTIEEENTDNFVDEIPEVSDNIEPISKTGDLWILGNHRLLCGDSTDIEMVRKVLENKDADLVVTDPPYNVDYSQRGKNRILNDNLGNDFDDFLNQICSNILAVSKGAIYIFMSISEIGKLKDSFESNGGHWSTFIVWSKNHFALGRSDYQRQYEVALYGWKEGSARNWCGARDQSDVWQEQIVGSNKLHPTMKPVKLIERMILNSSKPNDIVFDPFGGSGSTLIASENLGRKSRIIEMDPKYVDVIIRRFQERTGQKAINAATGKEFN